MRPLIRYSVSHEELARGIGCSHLTTALDRNGASYSYSSSEKSSFSSMTDNPKPHKTLAIVERNTKHARTRTQEENNRDEQATRVMSPR